MEINQKTWFWKGREGEGKNTVQENIDLWGVIED